MSSPGVREPPPISTRFPVFFGASFHAIHCTIWGRPDSRRRAVCVHGFLMNGREFDPLAAALAAEGWCVFCPDLSGHGRSGWRADAAEYRFPLYAAVLSATIAIAGSTRIDLIGGSMGGLIAMRLAGLPEAPFRSLVLNDVGTGATPEGVRHVASLIPRETLFPDIASAEAALRRLVSDRGPLADEEWPAMMRAYMTRTQNGYRFRFDPRVRQALTLHPYDRPDEWLAITIPTLLVRGARSEMLSAETAARMIATRPNAELLTLPGAGHPPWLRTRDQIDPIVDWLKRRED
ncbi:MAG: alpha/beta hydrolase [Alphaproteobacteria bacterium]|nr:alpha/beta hydrolase [Alphaproteobacteria bacterium]